MRSMKALTIETQSAQREHRESIQLSVLPPCPLCLCGEYLVLAIKLK